MRRFEQAARQISRRQFVAATTAVAGGLVVGFRPLGALAQDPVANAPQNPLQGYIRIDADNRVTVLCAHMEGGQGIHTGIATLVAEELGADWTQVGFEAASGNPALYGNTAMGGAFQLTGGSTGLFSSWDRYRQAGAVARELLKAAAAEAWRVPIDEIEVSGGTLSHASGERGAFGEFVERAAALPAPADVRLKSAADWSLIGNEALRRPDSAGKTRGQQDYTIDVQLPGMLTALLRRPPRFGGTVQSFNAEPVRAMPGIVDVVETPRGVAVVGKSYWEALKARDQLEVAWNEEAAEKRSSDALMNSYRGQASQGEGVAVHGVGNAGAELAAAERKVDAEFEFPYLAHAALEPLNAVARFENGILDIWAGHQMPDLYQQVAAGILGIAPEKRATARHDDRWIFRPPCNTRFGRNCRSGKCRKGAGRGRAGPRSMESRG